MGNSVNVGMPLPLLLLLVLPLSNRVSSEQSRLEEEKYKSENLNGIDKKADELMQRMERLDISWKLEKADLEKKLETKNAEVENLQERVKEGEVQFESRVEGLILRTQRKNENQEVASLKSEMRADVKEEVDKGLRDLPSEMVCAYKGSTGTVGVINYDRITMEFNNSNRPGGADGRMNIETGIFTTVTSGYYIVTYSATVDVIPEEYTSMYLHHNGAAVEESRFVTLMHVGSGDNYIGDQGSRTVILHLLEGDTLDLRTQYNSDVVYRITLCLYMAPAPYSLKG